ncbi:sugar phosphate isomerase/epimerase [Paenibacillus sp. V4I3]|uniref:sugar phosphate isomerase/epimerase family protein n=1 Tax=unclassified Paenibacillus TaxID=185978 RepID=UPI002788AA0C|nr:MULTISPECIES: sugar phosphate isomerase/epimerase [unclassified Paenibacillus]MDQ0872973.1 sugar phosphate isomerase/epimerase [Paenibacillus sp. V4I3]MDQ0891108.1 sugar phosphate isomerase/epimerase [Paenibacillus sp. V4I9]
MSISIGVNLFSVFQALNNDYFGTLEKVASAGYTNVELITTNFMTGVRYSDSFPLQTIKNKLEELGLKPIASHERLDQDAQNWDQLIQENAELGCKAIVMPSAWIKNREDTLVTAEQLNAIGKKCTENGLQFYFHNHFHEFKRWENTTLYDILVENTDPAYVKFELDLVWVMRAGLDPIAVLEKLGSRCDIVHQKDLNKEVLHLNVFDALQPGDEDLDMMQLYRGKGYIQAGDFVDLGTGSIDFKATYDKIKEMGTIQYAFIENEGISDDKFTSIKNDLKLLQKYV